MAPENEPLLGWSDEYLVGVPEIDAQHRRLVQMLFRFYASLSDRSQSRAALGELVCGLLDYTRYHFTTEERLMRTWDFPESEAHRKQHESFVTRTTDLATRFTEGRLVLSIEATSFLREWLVHHIQGTDRVLANHIIARGGGA